MKRRFGMPAVLSGLSLVGLTASTVRSALPPDFRHVAAKHDMSTADLLRQVETATRSAKTMTADFTYSVSSVKSQQFITGSLKMMKPNLARVRFTYMAKPAFPNLFASDGKTVYSFIPVTFRPDRKFDDLPFDPTRGAQYASGTMPGGGRIGTDPADPQGANVHLWDAVPVQAFFGPSRAISNYLYMSDPNTMRYEGVRSIDGVEYRVLESHFVGGNIAGGEKSDFEQHLYIGSDNLIHGYVLEFVSVGRPGIQIAWLKNIRVNVPLSKSGDFTFSAPID